MHTFLSRSTAFSIFLFVSIIRGHSIQQASLITGDVADGVDTSTLEGKFLFGYQGFFRRPGQGNDHWTISGGIPGPSFAGDGEKLLSFA